MFNISEITRIKLLKKINNVELFVPFLLEYNIIKETIYCSKCKVLKKIKLGTSSVDSYYLCENYKHYYSRKKIKHTSPFKNLKISLEKVILILYEWTKKHL